jgi:hypothetical protein
MAADFRAIRDVELALHVSVVADAVSPFMAAPDTDPAALHAADSLVALPNDPTAATEEILRRRKRAVSPTSSLAPTPPTRSLLSSPS